MGTQPIDFISKWKAIDLTESAASHSHFIDLCHLLDEPTPTDADHDGSWYCFERGATKTTGGKGWADVWKRECFGWEYKGKHKDLTAAFVQLQRYALALENPPLLVVCDLDRFKIHTNWTNSVSATHEFSLNDLRDAKVRQALKWVWSDPEKLKPGKTRAELTEEAAAEFAALAQRLRSRGHSPEAVAHFVNRLVFCMFAEDAGLLPERMFKRMLEQARRHPGEFSFLGSNLFRTMKEGGWIGFEQVDWFNGGLFDDDVAIPLDGDDIALVQRVAGLVWSEIDTSIFGTLFERGLDPDKRSQLGAHYTDREKIMLIVKPVIIDPWLAEWEEVKTTIAAFASTGTALKRSRPRQRDLASATYRSFLNRLRSFRVLDPACGSGNFLYLALLALKDIEHRVLIEAEALGFEREFPRIGPEAVKGIEINAYAAELARVTVWIGEIQWMRRNGFGVPRDPILKPLDNIECRDALMNPDGTIAVWPSANVAIGNPPFLGNKRMFRELTEPYAAAVRTVYRSQLSRAGDLVCFWFAKAWEMIEAGRLTRAGFVATNSIRSGSSNEILGVISDRGRIFEAWDDEPWVVDGAAVRVSLIAFDCGGKSPVRLDGSPVPVIHSNLTTGNNITQRIPLSENMHVCFVGVILNGNFEITGDLAREFLCCPDNVNGRSNADVIRPTLNGNDFNGDRPDKWVIDFGTSMSEADAALYERPFGFIEKQVKPYRQRRNEDHEFAVRARNEREIWWRHARARPAMRRALAGLERYIATPMVSSYRTFDYLPAMLLPDQKLVVFARDDDAFLGIVQSRVHHLWTIATCSWIGSGNDVTYPNTAVFETFPFPDGLTPVVSAVNWDADPRAHIIAKSASRLRTLRDNWLYPGSLIRRETEVVPGYPDRIVPIDEKAGSELKKRTLGNLYGEQPTWLQNAHRDLDNAVCAAYRWPVDISDDDALGRLLELNRARAAAQETRPIRIPRPGPQRTLLLPIAGEKEPVVDHASVEADPPKKRERGGARTA